MGKRIQYRMTLKRAADHEAAHAVLAEAYDSTVTLVVVRQTKKTKQWVGFNRTKGGRMDHPVPSSVVSYAGSVAETLWHGESRENVSGGDYKMLVAMGMPDQAMTARWPHMAHAWPLLWRLTAGEVRRHAKEIRRVSAALRRRKRLTGDQVRALIAKAR